MDMRRRAKSEINVTPLIDIVLVLLIVFIVLMPSLSKVLPVSVPKAAAAVTPPPDPANPPVVVSVLQSDSGFRCQLQSEPIELGALAERLAPVLERQVPGLRRVFLKVDGEVPYQAAVAVLDQVRRASDEAKRRTLAQSRVDGGDAKVVLSLRK